MAGPHQASPAVAPTPAGDSGPNEAQGDALNFLAHLWLADRTGTSLAGAILGDVIRGADLSSYPADIRLGVRLHRRVDAVTDRHPLMLAARAGFADGQRRYAGIVLDLAADHALCQRWQQFGRAEPLAGFCERSGVAIAAAGAWFEQAGGRRADADSFAKLLRSYASEAGIARALVRTAARMQQPHRLIDAGRQWQQAAQVLGPRLPALLDDLLAAMRTLIEESAQPG